MTIRFIDKKILLIDDITDGITIHLYYLKLFLQRHNSVKVQNTAAWKEIRAVDVIWFRTESSLVKLFLPCLLFRKTMIFDLSSMTWLELRAAKRSWLRVQLSLQILKLAASIGYIRVLSDAMRQYLLHHFSINNNRILVIYLPVEFKVPVTTRLIVDKINFLFDGTDRAKYDLPFLIQAFNSLESEPEFILHCYGIENQNTKNIIFHKQLPHELFIQTIIQLIDVIIFPMERNEMNEVMMPLLYAEAIHLDKFVLATNLSVLHEIANEKVFFIEDTMVETLVNGIKSFKSVLLKS